MKVLVLDADQAHNKKISQALSGQQDIHAFFFQDRQALLEVLNGFPALEQKKAESEKHLNDAKTQLIKVSEGLDNTNISINECKKQIEERKFQKEDFKPLEKQLADLSEQLNKASSFKKEVEGLIAKYSQEVEKLNKEIPKNEEKKCHVVLVDCSFMGNSPAEWIGTFRGEVKLKENSEVPVVAMAYSDKTDFIRKILVAGAVDYLLKPIDVLLFKHKVVKVGGGKIDSQDKMYELQTKTQIKLLHELSVIKMSEFEIDLKCPIEFKQNGLVEFVADFFSPGKNERILARVLSCGEDANEKKQYITSFTFVGMSQALMNEMRKWLRLQYVEQKSKSQE